MNVGVFEEESTRVCAPRFEVENIARTIALLIYDLKRRSKTVSLLSDGRMRPADARRSWSPRATGRRGRTMALPDIGVDDR